MNEKMFSFIGVSKLQGNMLLFTTFLRSHNSTCPAPLPVVARVPGDVPLPRTRRGSLIRMLHVRGGG